jgi:hypothetical protein
MDERRSEERKPIIITTIIRKIKPQSGHEVLELKSKDLCLGGIFISTEDLSLFDLGEEMEILVDDDGKRYYTGNARVVRSARMVSEEGEITESGFGLMFTSADEEFQNMVREKLLPL